MNADLTSCVVMENVPDKHKAAADIRRSLKDMPVSKDIVVTTPDEIVRLGHITGTVIRAALHEGIVVYEQDR